MSLDKMAASAALPTVDAAVPSLAARSAVYDRLCDYVELTKPRIALMVLLTTAVGAFVAAGGRPEAWVVAHAVVGTALVAAGSCVLNQVIERKYDALMRRTADRPLPAGRIDPLDASLYGGFLAITGAFYLSFASTPTAVLCAAASFVLYVWVYTPMKRFTAFNTAVGAVSGALPPVIGWAAATNEIGFGGLFFFLLLFAWQFPHFFAIAWMYRDDYARGG
ncbi:MAG: heme o synthase, partial [Planctomycetia bacterium]